MSGAAAADAAAPFPHPASSRRGIAAVNGVIRIRLTPRPTIGVLVTLNQLKVFVLVVRLGSMRAAFQLKYVRTHWEKRQAVFSPKFNRFVRDHVLG